MTYEVANRGDGDGKSTLRIVPTAELHSDHLDDTERTPSESRDEAEDGCQFDLRENGELVMRNNRLTVDDTSRQTLSMDEIEELKKMDTGSGRQVIAKIVAAHSGIDEKTAFSLAKYIKRKHQKYLKRFTILPLDVNILANIILEKEPSRTMELRIESLGLITSWANVHHGIETEPDGDGRRLGGGRWLVVEDTGGLVVAAMAEKMGILYPTEEVDAGQNHDRNPGPEPPAPENGDSSQTSMPHSTSKSENRPPKQQILAQSATHNTITVIHSNTQPNLSILKHFDYSIEDPDDKHPLYTHLKTLTWLQFLDPEADALYHEPSVIPDSVLSTMKSGKKGSYYRKRRRWQRIRSVVEETQAGGFDGCVIASYMKAPGLLKHLVPLVRGGGQIVVYSPTVEPLTELMDMYSRDRKSAFVKMMQQQDRDAAEVKVDEEDFPLNPTLLLNPMLQTARARHWQVLPGRTHPRMTSRGGAEGYIFSSTRVYPASGRVEARGKFSKKRKAATLEEESSKKVKTEERLTETSSDAVEAKVDGRFLQDGFVESSDADEQAD